VNRSDVFVQQVRFHSCQTVTGVGGCFLRTDTGVNLIGDVVTTTHSLVLAEIKGCQNRHLFLGKYGILISRILKGNFVSSRDICCGKFRKSSDQ
jgi:hypothetical protein